MIKESLLNRHLPDITQNGQTIHLEKWARRLSSFSQYRISEQSVSYALQSFFYQAQKLQSADILPSICKHLDSMLSRQADVSKVRRHFLTLAYLSYKANSTTIPSILLQFFHHSRDEIANRDYVRLGDWEHAIRHLKGLASSNDIYRELNFLSRKRNQIPYFHNKHSTTYDSSDDDTNYFPQFAPRGRRPNRLAYPSPRARTMPPVYYPPMPRIAAPNFLALPPARGILTEFPSPSVFAQQDPFREAEMDEIRAQQEWLAEQVEQLALGQQALEDEVQVQGDGYTQGLIAY